MVDTRTANATAHPGQVQIQRKRKRRTAAQMKAARDAEEEGKMLDVEKSISSVKQELLMHRIAVLENELVEGRAAAHPSPPIRANLVVQKPGNGGPSASRNAAKNLETPANNSQSAQPFPLSQPRTKYTRAEIATMRAALSTPTRKGAGVQGKMLVIPGQGAGGGKRKSEGNASSNKKAKPPPHSGFRKDYAASSSSKGKGIQVDKVVCWPMTTTLTPPSRTSTTSATGNLTRGMVEGEAIVISSDDDGEGGNNVPGQQLLFGHRMTTE
ncbi:hypothetical protein PHLCEN_2v2329, partial [Hermanssonia centrifuga]